MATTDNDNEGMTIETLKAGDATNFPSTGNTCRMHYEGRLTNGEKFDSSRDRGRPFQFRLGIGQVIRGWDIGVAQMSVGQVCRMTIPSELAYGEDGYPPIIPPNSTLIFDVELLSFTD